jgi:hypothetical protein
MSGMFDPVVEHPAHSCPQDGANHIRLPCLAGVDAFVACAV